MAQFGGVTNKEAARIHTYPADRGRGWDKSKVHRRRGGASTHLPVYEGVLVAVLRLEDVVAAQVHVAERLWTGRQHLHVLVDGFDAEGALCAKRRVAHAQHQHMRPPAKKCGVVGRTECTLVVWWGCVPCGDQTYLHELDHLGPRWIAVVKSSVCVLGVFLPDGFD